MNPTVKLKDSKDFDKYDCGSGPRPPVPGEESHSTKMTAEDACIGASNLNRSPTIESSSQSPSDLSVRIANWQRNFSFILDDQDGIKLLFKYVVDDAGKDSVDYARLQFYFACRGLKTQADALKTNADPEMQRRRITAIYGILKKQSWAHVSAELRNTIRKIQKEEVQPDPNIFDEIQHEVEKTISDKIYPSFFASPVFIEFAEQVVKNAGSSVVDCRVSCTNTNPNTADGTINSINIGASASVDLLSTATSLQTLHEDVELKLNVNAHPSKSSTTTHRSMPKLTSDLLLATQRKRLEVRPSGAHGYINSVFSSSYNPVSCQDSERQSCSSASLTDSEVNSKDGKPLLPRRPTAAEDHKRSFLNPPVSLSRTLVRPSQQGLKENVEPVSRSRMEQSSFTLDKNKDYFIQKLEELKKEREKEEKTEQFSQTLNDRLKTQTIKSTHKMFSDSMMKSNIEDEGESILDQHVSRVFSPPRESTSPHYHRPQRHRGEIGSSMPDFGMPTSRSIPERASEIIGSSLIGNTSLRKMPYGHSYNAIDSGISLYSSDYMVPPYRQKMDPYSEEILRPTDEETRRLRKQTQIQQQFSHSVNTMLTSSSHHTNSLPRLLDSTEEFTYVVYTFSDDKIPFRIKLKGKRITLKQFKDNCPRKGNFRYFFKVNSDDPDNPVLNEEIVDDQDLLPLYEGKIMGMISD